MIDGQVMIFCVKFVNLCVNCNKRTNLFLRDGLVIATAECRIAEKRYHHDEQEVARVKEVQVDHRAITLKTNITNGNSDTC